MDILSGVGGGGSGGALPPPPRLVSKCRNFGQFHIIWAILHQNFWAISYILGKFASKFWAI